MMANIVFYLMGTVYLMEDGKAGGALTGLSMRFLEAVWRGAAAWSVKHTVQSKPFTVTSLTASL